jgi:SAM-dependent methyltransferase
MSKKMTVQLLKVSVPYFLGRVVRKFAPFGALPKPIRQKIPGFQPNLGEQSQTAVFGIYSKSLDFDFATWLEGKIVLEIGTGRTNGCCYMFASKGAAKALSLEPFRPLDIEQDSIQIRDTASLSQCDESILRDRVKRIDSFCGIPNESCDAIFSLAVLEHVESMEDLTNELWRVLKPGGWMVHVVDYRDHFFKYPYHHLLWSQKTWDRYLNPGDLPRWRIGDHVECFKKKGFATRVLSASPIDHEFKKIQTLIHPEIKERYSIEDIQTAFGKIWAEKPHR